MLRGALVATGIVGGLAALNWSLAKVGEPVRLVGGEERHYSWRGWNLTYQVAGETGAPPLLLVHGIYAGASSYEFRKNFKELAENFRVYALDLLGWGLSERPRRSCGSEDVAAQVEDFAREEIGLPMYLVASLLSATLLVPAAVRNPRLFKKLILICPSGLGSPIVPPGSWATQSTASSECPSSETQSTMPSFPAGASATTSVAWPTTTQSSSLTSSSKTTTARATSLGPSTSRQPSSPAS